jgi:hypothetical protein
VNWGTSVDSVRTATSLRLLGWLLLGYGALTGATVAAVVLGEDVGLWARILWGLVPVVLVIYLVWAQTPRKRLARRFAARAGRHGANVRSVPLIHATTLALEIWRNR